MSAPKIPAGPEGQRVREAFAERELDPGNPEHWLALVNAFVGSRPVGAPKQWTEERLTRLRIDAALIRRKNPAMREPAVCRALVKRPEYRRFKPETLRKLIHDSWKKLELTPAAQAMLDYLVTNYETPDGDNSLEALLKWAKWGSFKFYEDASGNLRCVPSGLRPVAK